MKPPEVSAGSIHEDYVALFRRLDENLRVASGEFDAAPMVSLVFEQLARGARPNDLFDWQAETPGSELAPYYRVLLDSYLDHLVYAEVDPGDVQVVNQLLQDILDGAEPDRVLGYRRAEPGAKCVISRPRLVVYAFKILQEIAALESSSAGSGGDGRDNTEQFQFALDRVANRYGLSPVALAEACCDASILADAHKLFAQQTGLSDEMQAVAAQETKRQARLSESELIREFAQAWRAGNRRGN